MRTSNRVCLLIICSIIVLRFITANLSIRYYHYLHFVDNFICMHRIWFQIFSQIGIVKCLINLLLISTFLYTPIVFFSLSFSKNIVLYILTVNISTYQWTFNKIIIRISIKHYFRLTRHLSAKVSLSNIISILFFCIQFRCGINGFSHLMSLLLNSLTLLSCNWVTISSLICA